MIEKKKTLLIISNKKDITTDLVIKKLTIKGHSFFRFNTEDFSSYEANISLSDISKSFIKSANKDLNFDSVYSIWYRRPKLPTFDNNILSIENKQFAQREVSSYLFNLWAILGNKKWVNDPFSLYKAERKAFQLLIAQKVKLNIPQTIITNSFQEFNKFISKNEKRVIVKPISHGGYGKNNEFAIFTTDLEKSEYTYSEQDIETSPFILQSKVKKKFDIRVTVFGDKIFAHKIVIKNVDNANIDWRVYNPLNLNYKRIKLPGDIELKIFKFMSLMKLSYGAFDFIIDNKGKWIFIEINPSGQFAWLEIATEDKLIDELINLLYG